LKSETKNAHKLKQSIPKFKALNFAVQSDKGSISFHLFVSGPSFSRFLLMRCTKAKEVLYKDELEH
jgi:hypothetical protein